MQTQQDNPVTIAVGFHLFPSRTQQLSPHTPKVLGWKRPGRIGSCRLRKSTREGECFFLLPATTPVFLRPRSGVRRNRKFLTVRDVPNAGCAKDGKHPVSSANTHGWQSEGREG